MEWSVRQNFLSATETGLVKMCFANTPMDAAVVKVRELGRYGNSGARLLLCFPGRGAPLVAKIHTDETKIIDEYTAAKSAMPFFKDAYVPSSGPAQLNGSCALLYWHQGAETQSGVVTNSYSELSKMVFGEGDWRSFACCDKDDGYIIGIFRKMFHRFDAARQARKRTNFVFRSEYKRYTRRVPAEAVLSAVLGSDRGRSEFSFLGAQIVNPLKFIDDEVFDRARKGWVGPVHGDLHATNVMVNKAAEEVHLIDFAWAKGDKEPRHILVDYVLMECSLRFLLFPHHVEPNEQMVVDDLLLLRDGAEQLVERTANSRLAAHYARLGLMLREIRDQAAPYLSEQNERGFLEYLAAQFLILFGQMTYGDYNRFMVARTLGMIARKLKTDKFGEPSSKKSQAGRQGTPEEERISITEARPRA